ncbi:MAG: TIM barrel protein, partial [Actinomycetota bacterium]|nr:TIM barrel protein [Actinomycetota bacterium]
MRFDVNLSILFTELELLRRPAAAAAAGFQAVEMWWPFDSPEPPDSEVDDLVRAVTDAGVRLACLNFYAGVLAGGDRGVLSIPAQAAAFTANVPVATELAARLGCGVLNALYGNRVDGVAPAEQDALAVANLAVAADAAARV